MPEVFVSIGSNIDRQHNIRGAIDTLRAHYPELRRSSVYENAAIGFEGDPFYNLVVAFETDESVDELRQQLEEIEKKFGRTRGSKRFAPRTLDLDLLLYGDLVHKDDKGEIPRSEITEYGFVLLPLAEIAPDRRHPINGEKFERLWQQMPKMERLDPIEWTD
jgi:2-amino-4-hydroxy-6-hydroxymethyldihydropteridine diphosphokinase